MTYASIVSLDLDALDFGKSQGCVTVVTQHATTGVVLMVAQADREALARTLATGEMHYTSRTRGLWHKGATSGNRQRVVSLTADCDADAVLARVIPLGPACHDGGESCFDETALSADAVAALDRTVSARKDRDDRDDRDDRNDRKDRDDRNDRDDRDDRDGGVASPRGTGSPPSYTRRLLADRNLRLKKLGEEMAEFITACADNDATRAAEEAADLVYHTIVALHAVGTRWDAVREILTARAGRGTATALKCNSA